MSGKLKNTFLIIGGTSTIGRAVAKKCISENHPVVLTCRGDAAKCPPVGSPPIIELDLCTFSESWTPPAGVGVALICAGITQTHYCRTHPTASREVNVSQTFKLCQLLAHAGIHVVVLSTNQVFDGSRPHVERHAPTNPQTEYGKQKAELESAVSSAFPEACSIVRLTKVVHQELSILKNWKNALQRDEVIHPFSDFYCAPIGLQTVADSLYAWMLNPVPGIHHLSGERDIAYAEMAWALCRFLRKPEALVRPIRVEDADQALEWNPRYTSLDMSNSSQPITPECLTPETVLDNCFIQSKY